MKALSWKPKKHGKIYCSSACGGGCTQAEYETAQSKSSKLMDRLGPGWKQDVWENLGWHWSVSSMGGHITIHPHTYKKGKTQYYALFSGESWATNTFSLPELKKRLSLLMRGKLVLLEKLLPLVSR